jgi:hypothetical protein
MQPSDALLQQADLRGWPLIAILMTDENSIRRHRRRCRPRLLQQLGRKRVR